MSLILLQEETRAVTVKLQNLITLEKSGIPGGDFAMRELDESHVLDLVSSDRSTWPAIRIAAADIGPILVDGRHRVVAATRQGATTLDAILQSYQTENDVIDAAFRANLCHGLKASEETRGDYAYWLHATYPGMKQEEIAKRAQITQSTVSKAIAKREAVLRNKALEEMGLNEEFATEQAFKQFFRRAVKFVAKVDTIQEDEFRHYIQASVKQEDRKKLARIGQILVAMGTREGRV
jgi:hypothetical protein